MGRLSGRQSRATHTRWLGDDSLDFVRTSEIFYNLAGDVKHQGLPVVGVSILLFEYWRLSTGLIKHLVGQQKTGSCGEFSFAVVAGSYCLEVAPDSTTSFVRKLLSDIKVVGNTTCHVSLVTGVIVSGSVVTASGVMVTHSVVMALGIEPCSYRVEQCLDSQGLFSMVLPKGRYCLAVRYNDQDKDNSGENSHTTGSPFIATTYEIIEVRQDMVHNIRLPEMVDFRGCILSHAGVAVSDAIVTLTPDEDNLVLADLCLKVATRTSLSGNFAISVQPGIYDLNIQPPPLVPLAELTVESITIATQTSRNFTLLPGVCLQGKVLFANQPVVGCLVKAVGQDGLTYVAMTDGYGEFFLKLPSGAYELKVVGQPDIVWLSANLSIAPAVRQVTADDDIYLTIELEGGLSVAGVVVDCAGRPRPQAKVSAVVDEGRIPLPGDTAVASGMAGDDGRYCLVLGSGCYWVFVNDEVGNAKHAEVSCEPVKLDLTWSTGCVVRFTVLSEADEPIGRCVV
ncbi:MAG: hypothetical protein HY711_03440, partial [Candidatus Melainabacteria bacterium]|nr:hypothetical protein [Candidatus Melainabacteria bacterium]